MLIRTITSSLQFVPARAASEFLCLLERIPRDFVAGVTQPSLRGYSCSTNAITTLPANGRWRCTRPHLQLGLVFFLRGLKSSLASAGLPTTVSVTLDFTRRDPGNDQRYVVRAAHVIIYTRGGGGKSKLALIPQQALDSRLRIFLDIDGVFIRGADASTWNGTWEVAPHAEEFLKWVLEHHQPIWLTARDTDGSGGGVLAAFRSAIGGTARLIALASHIQSQAWRGAKTTAMDFSRPFLWLDDCPRTEDLLTLEAHGCVDQWIEVNTDLRPDDLLRVMCVVSSR